MLSDDPSVLAAAPRARLARRALGLTWILIACNVGLLVVMAATGRRDASFGVFALFCVVAVVQVGASLTAMVAAILVRRARGPGASPGTGTAWLAGGLTVLAPVGWLIGAITYLITGGGAGGLGGAWGRPLRIRGRQRHPGLRAGASWAVGPRPDPSALDAATRTALEALWLHDAQKEHASVPAFARVSWLLAAAGAPSELLEGAHRAAIEEIEHARLCFALAAGYGGRAHAVDPMPELVTPDWGGRADPRLTLARESLADGCLLEDYNADVAAACAAACTEPVTRAGLDRIALEERDHARLSWDVLAWLIAEHADVVRPLLVAERARLDAVLRPTAVSALTAPLVAAADAAALRAHGRLPDVTWAALWDARLVATRLRLDGLLAASTDAVTGRAAA